MNIDWQEHENLVYSVMLKYGVRKGHSRFDDIAQAGRQGLLLAANTYDSSNKCAFATHAYFYVRKMIQTEIGRMSQIVEFKSLAGVTHCNTKKEPTETVFLDHPNKDNGRSLYDLLPIDLDTPYDQLADKDSEQFLHQNYNKIKALYSSRYPIQDWSIVNIVIKHAQNVTKDEYQLILDNLQHFKSPGRNRDIHLKGTKLLVYLRQVVLIRMRKIAKYNRISMYE